MKQILFSLFLYTSLFAYFENIDSFEADFNQTVSDDNNKVLSYKGSVVASKPQNVLWTYVSPVKKNVYINSNSITIIEPELEQVIIKRIESNFNFFNMIKNAKKIEENVFVAHYKESKFTITTEKNLIKSISYLDEFENNVKIVFQNQKQNEQVNSELFIPVIPEEFDVIED